MDKCFVASHGYIDAMGQYAIGDPIAVAWNEDTLLEEFCGLRIARADEELSDYDDSWSTAPPYVIREAAWVQGGVCRINVY